MGILKKVRDKTGTIHELGDSRVDAFETELSGAEHNVPYSPAVLGKANAIEKKIDDHAANMANPHGVTKEQLGLANVENKSSTQIRSEITKENVTAALGYTPIDESRIGAANGVASLDAGGRIPASQIPGGFDNIDEYDSLADFPETGEEGKIYVTKDTNLTYRWTGTQYVEISPSLALGETATTAYRGDRGKAAYEHSQVSGDSTIHHVHANKELLDSYAQTEADLANAVAKVHEHGNKAVLDGITADKVSEWDGKQDRLTAGDGISISDNVIANTNKVVNTQYSFSGKSGTDDYLILIATVPYNSMSVTHIISTDITTSYAWGLDIAVETTKDKAVHVTGTTRVKPGIDSKPCIVVGYYQNNIVVCIPHSRVSSGDHNIRTTALYTQSCTLPPGYHLLAASDVDETYTTYALNWKKFIDAESTARADADTVLGNRITTLEGKTKLSDFEDDITTGEYSETGTAPVNGRAVASAVSAESTARSEADATLQGNIDTEASARTEADTALGGRIDEVNAKGLTVKEIDGEQVLCFE